MEGWEYPSEAYELVISRMALHYVEDYSTVFQEIYQSLRTGGRFIFSVLHPVISSCKRAVSEFREDWIVDDYFVIGERNVLWMDTELVQYHRTIEVLLQAIINKRVYNRRFT